MAEENVCVMASIRQELKSWEKAFSAANGGRKAGREDIKADPIIAAKYREYDKYKNVRTKQPSRPKQPVVIRDSASPRRTKTSSSSLSVPVAVTPRKNTKTTCQLSSLPSPARELETTPHFIRQRLGPTPQKDGRILSLFEDIPMGTPSKPRDALASIDSNILATPSRSRDLGPTSSAQDAARLSKTPTSSGRRFMLDAFATPMKRKRNDENKTPSSARGSAETPAFLRRTAIPFSMDLDAVDEMDEAEAVKIGLPPFKKKRGLVRSLSAIIQNLKQQEEDDADEEMELMREMEMEAEAGAETQISNKNEKTATEPTIQVEDSQVVMPLGPDRAAESSEDEGPAGDGLDHNGNPRKVWKKKGLKRQTRRVIMRPVSRPKTAEVDPVTAKESIVHETQFPDIPVPRNADSDDSDVSEFDEDESNEAAKAKNDTTATDKPEGIVTKAKRKIKASAHANYCKLKIKNKNSKANGRGRFGRR